MVHNADQYVATCEADHTNEPGTCLMSQREYAGIGSLYPDAATAWRNTNQPHPGDRHPPKGAAVYWTGGSHGYGHIACSLGNGRIRSTDCTSSGHLSDVDLSWVEQHWGLTYAGWAPDINEVTIPGVGAGGGGKDDPLANYDNDQELSSGVLHGHEWSKSGDDPKENLQQHVTDLRRDVNAINERTKQILELLKKG